VAYLLIDDRSATHPKLLAVSHQAFRLWFSGLCYCQLHLTNGVISAGAVDTLPGFSKGSLNELLRPHQAGANPLWILRDDGSIAIHDYLQWNQSKEEIARRRAGKAERMRQWRDRRGGAVDAPRDTPQDAPQDAPVVSLRDAPRAPSPNHKYKYNPNLTVAKATGGAAPLAARRNTRVLNDGDAVQCPAVLADEFQAVIAPRLTNGEDPYAALLEWTHRVSDRLVAEFGGAPEAFLSEPFRAWKQELAKDWAVSGKAAGPTCCKGRHTPPCPDEVTCTNRRREDARQQNLRESEEAERAEQEANRS
jgi:hypothetical protein